MSLYKYYNPESFDYIFLDNGVSVRFSQPSVLNDIFELSGSFDENSDILKQKIISYLSEKCKAVDRLSKEEINPLIEEFKPLYISKIMNEFKDRVDRKFGILALTSNNNSRSMWSYYGIDNHGFMIKFKTDKNNIILPNMKAIRSDFVTYEETRPTHLLQIAEKATRDFEEKLMQLIYTKDQDWVKEEEFRIVATLQNVEALKTDPNGFPIHSMIVDPNGVEEVTLGARAGIQLERKIKFWIRSHAPNVKLSKAEPCNKEYKFNYLPIET